jgi:hypothetical protein
MTRAKRLPLLGLVATAATIATAGLGYGNGEDVGDGEASGIKGRVTITSCAGPQREGQKCGRPYDARLRIKRASDGEVVKRVRSGDDGRFRVRVRPGRYVVQPRSGEDRMPYARPRDVTVRRGQFTRVRIHYESGLY